MKTNKRKDRQTNGKRSLVWSIFLSICDSPTKVGYINKTINSISGLGLSLKTVY